MLQGVIPSKGITPWMLVEFVPEVCLKFVVSFIRSLWRRVWLWRDTYRTRMYVTFVWMYACCMYVCVSDRTHTQSRHLRVVVSCANECMCEMCECEFTALWSKYARRSAVWSGCDMIALLHVSVRHNFVSVAIVPYSRRIVFWSLWGPVC